MSLRGVKKVPAIALTTLESRADFDRLRGLLLTHKDLGTGTIVGVRMRYDASPLIYVSFPVSGRARFNFSAIQDGLIESVSLDSSIDSADQQLFLERLLKQTRDLALFESAKNAAYSILELEHEASFTTSELSLNDLRLVAAWASVPKNIKISNLVDLASIVGDYRAALLCSARQAEIVAAHYLRQFYGPPRDLALEQITEKSDLWRKADLKVGRHLIDVKNARRSYTSPNSYSEQFVKAFKKGPESSDVGILGVLSDYVPLRDFITSQNVTAVILGHVFLWQLEQIGSWVNKDFGEVLTAKGVSDRADHLPGWVFEYSPAFYREWSPLAGKINRSLSKLKSRKYLNCSVEDSALRPFFVLFCPERSFDPTLHVCVKRFKSILRSGIRRCGLSRRVVFLSIIFSVLLSLRNNEDIDFDELKKSIFPSRSDFFGPFSVLEDQPFGLYDPCMYISNILDSLQKAETYARERLRRIELFSLRAQGILRGRTSEGSWISILAYCGGWNKSVGAKCGYTPLIIGESEICPACGRLICPSCNYCSAMCNR